MIRAGQPEIDAITRIIQSGDLFRHSWDSDRYTETEVFEREWAEKIGVRHALAVTSGTAALICACAAAGIGPGDEVIVPGYTFIATAIAPLMCGAIPVLAEINETLLIDPADIERHISPRTKAIIPVHMLGMPADMDPIMAIARKHDLLVIEDACQMDAGSYQGRRTGSIGDMGCFSFNFFKIMTCGEGGAMVTDREDLFARASMMHDGGASFWPSKDQTDLPFFIGLEFRFNNILAAMLREQIKQVDDWLTAGRTNKQWLAAELSRAGMNVLPSNDIAGDCGLVCGVQLPTEAETLHVQQTLKAQQIAAWRPFDTDRHVYCNWTPILEHRAWHCDGMNPFLHPANQGAQMQYTPDMLPRTLDILKRTLLVNLNPFMTEDARLGIAQAISTAGGCKA